MYPLSFRGRHLRRVGLVKRLSTRMQVSYFLVCSMRHVLGHRGIQEAGLHDVLPPRSSQSLKHTIGKIREKRGRYEGMGGGGQSNCMNFNAGQELSEVDGSLNTWRIITCKNTGGLKSQTTSDVIVCLSTSISTLSNHFHYNIKISPPAPKRCSIEAVEIHTKEWQD